MSAGYWIVRGKEVKNNKALQEYAKLWPPIAKKYGARVVGGTSEKLFKEGPEFSRVLVIEFPSYRDACDCYEDPDYKIAMNLAHKAYDS